VVNLRFATACGASPRLRLDLVLNDFVASAVCTGTITVLSDGSPWRPLIDVEDMARAFEWAVTHTPATDAHCTTVNVGGENYQVSGLAEAVARQIPGTKVSINTNAAPDKRSYRVDFSRFQRLAPGHQPARSLEDSIAGLHQQVKGLTGLTADFRTAPEFIRLKALERLVKLGKIDADLRWRERAQALAGS
jgi:nucleoside-diphosphate-sugar epimerase